METEQASAQGLIRLHGNCAADEALEMAGKMLARGDQAGHDTWMRIARLVREAQGGG